MPSCWLRSIWNLRAAVHGHLTWRAKRELLKLYQQQHATRATPLPALLTEEERATHEKFIAETLKDNAIWKRSADYSEKLG